MPIRSNLPVPTCPVTVELLPGQPAPVICADDWNALASSVKFIQDSGKVIFEARQHRTNDALFIPLSGWNVGAGTTMIYTDYFTELFSGLDKFVVVLDLKLYQIPGTPNRYQRAVIQLIDGNTFQTIADYNSNPADPNNIGAVFTTKIDTGTINANIMPQPGTTKRIAIRLVLTTTNGGPIFQYQNLNNRGIFGVQIKQIKHC